MSNLTSQIEARAKELYGLSHPPADWDELPKDYFMRDEYLNIGRHTIKLELEARIDSLGKVPAGMFDSSPYVQKMINELTTQLNQLEQ